MNTRRTPATKTTTLTPRARLEMRIEGSVTTERSIAHTIHDRRPLRLVLAARRPPDVAYMTVNDLDYLCRQIFASTAWKGRLAALIEVDVTTISRWCSGALPLPKWLAILVWALWTARMHGAFPVPSMTTRWDCYAWIDGMDEPPRRPGKRARA